MTESSHLVGNQPLRGSLKREIGGCSAEIEQRILVRLPVIRVYGQRRAQNQHGCISGPLLVEVDERFVDLFVCF